MSWLVMSSRAASGTSCRAKYQDQSSLSSPDLKPSQRRDEFLSRRVSLHHKEFLLNSLSEVFRLHADEGVDGDRQLPLGPGDSVAQEGELREVFSVKGEVAHVVLPVVVQQEVALLQMSFIVSLEQELNKLLQYLFVVLEQTLTLLYVSMKIVLSLMK